MKRLFALVAVSAGILGVAACLAAVYPAWMMWARIAQVHERAFIALDQTLADGRDRVLALARRADDAGIAMKDLRAALRDDVAEETRAESRAGLDRRVESLGLRLQGLDSWLDS